MFTREQASRLTSEFWTTFGRYMSPVPSADGRKINWVNYHTGVKDIYFRMNAIRESATIAISCEHPDTESRRKCFEKLMSFRSMLREVLAETWEWKSAEPPDDSGPLQVFRKLEGYSVLIKEDWPELISFFKPRIIALDEFWSDARYSFQDFP